MRRFLAFVFVFILLAIAPPAGGNSGILITGLTCDGVTDNRAVIQAAIDAVPRSATLLIPPSALGCGVSENGSNGYALLVNKPIILTSEHGPATGACIRPLASVGSNVDTIKFIGSTSFNFTGAGLRDICIGNPTNGTRAGRHGVYIDTTVAGSNFPQFLIDNVQIYEGSGSAIYHENAIAANANGGMFAARIRNSLLGGGIVLMETGDSITIEENRITGSKVGIRVRQTPGASKLTIGPNNNIPATGGGIAIERSQGCLIYANQAELFGTGGSGGSNGAVFDLNGSAGQVRNCHLLDNLVAGAPAQNITSLIRLRNTQGVTLEGNDFVSNSAPIPYLNADTSSDLMVGRSTFGTPSGGVVLGASLGTVMFTYNGGAWTPYTPAVSAQSGAVTSYTSSGSFIKVGKLVQFRAIVIVIANGSGAIALDVALPAPALAGGTEQAVLMRNVSTGNTGAGRIRAPELGNVARVTRYDGAYPAGDGQMIVLSGSYEAQ